MLDFQIHFQPALIPVNWEPLFKGSGRLWWFRLSQAMTRTNTQDKCFLTGSSGTVKTLLWKIVVWVAVTLGRKEKIVWDRICKKVGVWIVNPELAGALV